MKTKSTCVSAKPNEITKGTWYHGPTQRLWFGEAIENGFPFTYKADKVQLTFLQLLSSGATQNITFHCRNTVAYFDKKQKTFAKAAIFRTYNDLELVAKKSSKFKYDVASDNCKNRQNNKWEKTVFVFTSQKTKRLPIVDVNVGDIGGENQAFGLSIGPVCFS